MSSPLDVDVITIFPGMVTALTGESILKRAVQHGLARIRAVDLRAFTTDVHQTTDDRPYGGGPGMIMKPEPIFKAVESLRRPETRLLLMAPQGRRFDQAMARELAKEQHLVIICGHYEGVDERVREGLGAEEVSIGDYILTNGVIPAVAVTDAVIRLLPGAIGGEGATEQESFNEGLLEYPHYTRPDLFRGMAVPEVLKSGDHAAIATWRRQQSEARTRERRPDLLEKQVEKRPEDR